MPENTLIVQSNYLDEDSKMSDTVFNPTVCFRSKRKQIVRVIIFISRPIKIKLTSILSMF